ncbi:MAG TPA: hypothetical protein VI037_05105, partial [Nitrososphaera sp.]
MAAVGGGSGQGPVTSRCAQCQRVLQPCPFCGHTGREITAERNEEVRIQENRTTILISKLKTNQRW